VFLEQTAANDADFRIPDERGAQPVKQPIEEGDPWGCRRHCALPLHAMSGTLEAAGLPVKVSSDAGRFLCNFAFYKSLSAAERLNVASGSRSKHASLFVHVPPFSVLPLERLVECAKAIVAEAAQAMRTGTEVYLASRNSLQRSLITAQAVIEAPDQGGDASGVGVNESGESVDVNLYGASKSSQALPREHPAVPPSSALEALLAFGFAREVCLAALAATNTRQDEPADRAAEWVFERGLEEGGDPLPATSSSSSKPLREHQPPVLGADAISYKLVVVVRSDIGMRPGKIASQACHGETSGAGSVSAPASRFNLPLPLVSPAPVPYPPAALKAFRRGVADAAVAPTVAAWQSQGEPIVVLRCDDLGHLELLRSAAAASGLPSCTVTDAGRTQVDPGTMTVLAVGPARAADVDAVTGGLKLL